MLRCILGHFDDFKLDAEIGIFRNTTPDSIKYFEEQWIGSTGNQDTDPDVFFLESQGFAGQIGFVAHLLGNPAHTLAYGRADTRPVVENLVDSTP